MFIKKLFLIVISFICCIYLYISSVFTKNVYLNKKLDLSKLGRKIYINGISADKKMNDEILFEIEVSSIGLKENVYNIDSVFNDVDKHVQILEQSKLENNLIFLAAHSGYSEVSYFNSLVNLEVGDMIEIKNFNKKLIFVVKEIYYVPKIGYVELNDDVIKDMLFLITCSLDYNGMQLVVSADLVYF